MTSLSPMRKVLLALTLGVVASCARSDLTAPRADTAQEGGGSTSNLLGFFEPKLLKCPTDQTISNVGVVDVLGGVVSADGTTISIPAGALLQPSRVTVTVPASKYMEVAISVEGTDHFVFELPVTVTVSYARCTRPITFFGLLTAWYIDSDTKDLLERMPSVDDKLTRTVTFTTGHLSGYALAN